MTCIFLNEEFDIFSQIPLEFAHICLIGRESSFDKERQSNLDENIYNNYFRMCI